MRAALIETPGAITVKIVRIVTVRFSEAYWAFKRSSRKENSNPNTGSNSR